MREARGHGWLGRRLLASVTSAALGLVGCAGLGSAPAEPAPALPPPLEEIRPVSHGTPVPTVVRPAKVPISLDAVFRLAEAQNPRIAQAREKLNESLMTQEMNCRNWLPKTQAGIAYYRHEGGIQLQDGRQIHSSFGAFAPGLDISSELDLRESTFRQLNDQRLIWQDKAELTKVDNEVLLEAATTYVDFLTARRGQAIAEEIEKSEKDLLQRAEKYAKRDVGATAFLESMKSASAARQATIAKVRQQGNAAMAKLVYLLGLPPGTELEPLDVPVPFELVDISPPTGALVTRAMQTGPGVHELSGLLGVIQTGLAKSYGPHNLLPTIGFTVFEGMLGSGPGGSTTWDNRLDIGFNLRWNLTALGQTEDLRRRARSRMAQTAFALQDLQGKLALGVQEGKDAVLHGREQIGLASTQLKHADESYRLNKRRLDREGPKAVSPLDVFLSLRSVEQAHFNRLTSISAHNKAQVRLVMLLGAPTKLVPLTELKPAPDKAPATLPMPQKEKKPDEKKPEEKMP